MTSSSARTPAAPARSADVTYGARTAGDCKQNILVMLIVMLVVGAKGRGSWLNGSGSLITLQTWSPEDGLNKIKLDPKKT